MRLLQVDENGEFSLTDDLIGNIPPYAILSHTWAEDHEEVNFKDLTIGPRKTKSGYQKLYFCAERAARDGLQHFWVDTCCIDKSNNTELSEAINSMFRWYRDATKCYVYLSDVATNNHDQVNPSLQSWELDFRKSRWFTRGWTLQELLAPPSVEFFCSNRKRLGDKKSLERLLHEITEIAFAALQGTPLSEFSVNERMSWAKTRQTKREEDRAYSLLGIFGIHMPLIYGEGVESAFKRLQEEIDKNSRPSQDPSPLGLPYAAEAPFNSYAMQHKPFCLPDTRVDLLREIYNWADGQDERSIFWLNGLAGTGKSTIARTVAQHYFEKGSLGASFFFSRDGEDISCASKFVTSIAVQLAISIPALRQYVSTTVIEHSNIASQSLLGQWRELVLRSLSKLDSNDCQSLYVIVVDALDECDDDNDIQIILNLLTKVRSLEKVQLRVFLTSRPEVPIRNGFIQIPGTEHQEFVLHNILPSIVDHDICIFFKHNLNLIAQERSLVAGWPGEQIIKRLIQSASGLFIWAATACRFIREGKQFAVRRLDTILKHSNTTINAPEKHLNEIYMTVLRHCISPRFTDEEAEELRSMLRRLLGSIVTLFSPLSTQYLSRLLSTPHDQVDQTVDDLHAILDIPKDPNRPLRIHHPSFRDFILNSDRCSDPNLWVDEKQAHQRLAENCIRLMSENLKRNVCDLGAPDALASEVASCRVEKCLPVDLQYACSYWVQHLLRSETRLTNNCQVHKFLQEHFLHWLEALSLIGKIFEGVHMVSELSKHLSTLQPKPRELYSLVHDAERFIFSHMPLIKSLPLQIYSSALLFSPQASIVRNLFQKEIDWVRISSGVEQNWSPNLQTLEGHLNSVESVAFSPDGSKLASGSRDHTMRVWDITTGQVERTLEGHSDWILSIVFSPNGSKLASASYDHTMVWDAITGQVEHTLEGHSGWVFSVMFSPDGSKLVSGSQDHTVRIWNVTAGQIERTLEGHLGWVFSVAFSPDGSKLASGSHDHTVRVWNVATGQVEHTLGGHLGWVFSVVFSPNGSKLASGSRDHTVRVWDVATGQVERTLEGHLGWVFSVAFSPDGSKLASGSHDHTVRMWDITTGQVKRTLEGHLDWVESVMFSPDGSKIASGSHDHTVRVWNVTTGQVERTLGGHLDLVLIVMSSPDGSKLASGQPEIIRHHVESRSFYSVDKSKHWVTRDGSRILYLPPDHRPACIATTETALAIGRSAGRVKIITFYSDVKT